MIFARTNRSRRTGGIYIVVLGTSMIVAVLGLATLVAQRIQNRMLTASADMRQAQLNAQAAVELALLTTRDNNNWRSLLDGSSDLFTNRSMGTNSTCSVRITDAPADPTIPIADRPITLLATGTQGPEPDEAARTSATQLVEVTVDPRRQPADFLKNGYTSAPDWNTIFAYYQSIGTAIDPNSLGPPQLARNGSLVLTNVSPYWSGDVVGLADAELQRLDISGSQFLRVYNRESAAAGAAHTVGFSVKSNKTYTASARVRNLSNSIPDRFRLNFYADPTSSPPTLGTLSPNVLWSDGWRTITLSFNTNGWTDSQLVGAIVHVQSLGRNDDFYVDDMSITENTTEKYIYRQTLSPNVNPFGTANANGVYYVDCGGTNTLVIERSRIIGTLLVINPGANSRIGDGPIHWSPAKPGYPILLVNGNFTIQSTAVDLSEVTNGVNFNPAGMPYYAASPSTDSSIDDTYLLADAIRGLILVSGNLSYQNSPRITGRVVVGGTPSGTPTFTYKADALLNPPPPVGGFYTYRYDRRPASTRKAVQ